MPEKEYRIDSPLSVFDRKYHSPLSVDDCIERITTLPCDFLFKSLLYTTVVWYKCETITETRLLITFTGGTFLGPRHTEYVVNFYADDQGTTITLHFRREWFLYPLPIKFCFPYTSTQEIDALMMQKTSAKKIS